MAVVLPIAKFLLRLVAPSIPELVSGMTALKQRHGTHRQQGETFEERLAELDYQFAQQLALIATLTKQADSIQTIFRLTLFISIAALLLSLTGLALMLYA